MKAIFNEFKEFAIKGNVVDMAVGIIIGTAFGKIITSLVGDIIMPPIGVLLGGADFSDLAITVKEAVDEAPAVVIGYGVFIQTILDFTIIAFAIFLFMKAMNSLKKSEKVIPVDSSELSVEEKLLTEIRDLLKEKK